MGDPDQERTDRAGGKYYLHSAACRSRAQRVPGIVIFEYLDEHGVPHRCAKRVVDALGKKQVYPGAPDGTGGWNCGKGATDSLRPLVYHLDRIVAAPPEQPLYFVEGEPAATYLTAIGALATTTPQGCKGRLDPSEFAIFAGRSVTVWPDNDDDGRNYARRIIAELQRVGATVTVLDPPGMPPKGDAVDWGGGRAELDVLAASAVSAEEWLQKGASTVERPVRNEKAQVTAADIVAIARRADIFRGTDGNTYVSFGGETTRLESQQFRAHLRSQFSCVLPHRALGDALEHLADCSAGAEVKQVYLRFAGHEGCVYWDLANGGQVVRIGPEGWEVVPQSPVPFIRPAPMQALPLPTRGGTLEGLGTHLNLSTREDRILVCAWLLGCLNPAGAKPLLSVEGEQGSTKTTQARALAFLLDPREPSVTSLPGEADLASSLQYWAVPVFDNVSALSPAMADALCRVCTGAGYTKRALYTNSDEHVVSFTRPLILTGISGVVRRSDLADRTVGLTLAPLPAHRRRPEAEFWADFAGDRPGFMGALCDAVSAALRNAGNVSAAELPRMADWFSWVLAGEGALWWKPGEFQDAYAANRQKVVTSTLEGDPVGAAIGVFCEKRQNWNGVDYWQGTPGALLGHLTYLAGAASRLQTWPASPAMFSRGLPRLAPFLREMGVEIHHRKSNGVRLVVVRVTDRDAQGHSPEVDRHCADAGNSGLSSASDGQGRIHTPASLSPSNVYPLSSSRKEGDYPSLSVTAAANADSDGLSSVTGPVTGGESGVPVRHSEAPQLGQVVNL